MNGPIHELNFDLPIDMMDQVIAYQMNPNPPPLLTPEQLIEAAVAKEEQFEQLFAKSEKVAKDQLQRLREEVLKPLEERLKEIAENNPNDASKAQMVVLQQSATDIKNIYERLSKTLVVSKGHLDQRKEQDQALRQEIRELHRKKERSDPLFRFLKQGCGSTGAFTNYAANHGN